MISKSRNVLEMGNIPPSCYMSAAASHLSCARKLRLWVFMRRLKTGWEFGKAKAFDLRPDK